MGASPGSLRTRWSSGPIYDAGLVAVCVTLSETLLIYRILETFEVVHGNCRA